MGAIEPKKLALIRILQILQRHSSYEHPLTQEEIVDRLEREYGIVVERKAVGRNLSLLKEAGYDICSGRGGSYLDEREFEDAELRLLIDSVLSSRHITARHSADLIEKLCRLSNKYFRAHVKNVFSVNDWSKTDNQALFYNIELIDDAIERQHRLSFDYNKYGVDKRLHRTKTHVVSPYQLLLHNQRYYLMALNERHRNITYYRVDRITGMSLLDEALTPLTAVPGYENGIDYKELSTALPYMYTDKPQKVTFKAAVGIVDQVVDWFGKGAVITPLSEQTVLVEVKVSVLAMEYWAMQYLNYVEILTPPALRDRISQNLADGLKKYQ